jgi:hypothetical protein
LLGALKNKFNRQERQDSLTPFILDFLAFLAVQEKILRISFGFIRLPATRKDLFGRVLGVDGNVV